MRIPKNWKITGVHKKHVSYWYTRKGELRRNNTKAWYIYARDENMKMRCVRASYWIVFLDKIKLLKKYRFKYISTD